MLNGQLEDSTNGITTYIEAANPVGGVIAHLRSDNVD